MTFRRESEKSTTHKIHPGPSGAPQYTRTMEEQIIIIETERQTHNAAEAAKRRGCMTVAELVNFLQYNYNDDTKVVFSFDNGYTYGACVENMFHEAE